MQGVWVWVGRCLVLGKGLAVGFGFGVGFWFWFWGSGGGTVEKGRSHCWIRVQARSLTALWMGIMEGIVRARESESAVDVVDGEVGRVCGLCLRRTAV